MRLKEAKKQNEQQSDHHRLRWLPHGAASWADSSVERGNRGNQVKQFVESSVKESKVL